MVGCWWLVVAMVACVLGTGDWEKSKSSIASRNEGTKNEGTYYYILYLFLY